MKLREAVTRLEETDEFKDFSKDSKVFLAHAFTMISEDKDDWQIGYCNKDTGKVSVFELGDKIRISPEEDVLKKSEKINALDLDEVKLDLEQALETINAWKQQKYPGESVTKKIVIVQNLEGKTVYNMTLVTLNFNIINLKMDAGTGEIISQKKHSILQLGKPMM